MEDSVQCRVRILVRDDSLGELRSAFAPRSASIDFQRNWKTRRFGAVFLAAMADERSLLGIGLAVGTGYFALAVCKRHPQLAIPIKPAAGAELDFPARGP